MKFVVLFQDNEENSQMRTTFMPTHLEFLAANSNTIQAAGPLAVAETGEPAGGLWMIEAPDLDCVKALIETDPFWPTGLRKSVKILKWQQVFANGKIQR